jgi:hypothetical protein
MTRAFRFWRDRLATALSHDRFANSAAGPNNPSNFAQLVNGSFQKFHFSA